MNAYTQLLERLRAWTRERQNTDSPLTFREVARRYRVAIADVDSMAIDADLSINVGGRVNGGYWAHENMGDYTLEDLSVTQQEATHGNGNG